MVFDPFTEEANQYTDRQNMLTQYLLKKVEEKKRIRNPKHLPKECRKLLIVTLINQCNSEWWGGAGYYECVKLAPTREEQSYMRILGGQEQKHGLIIALGPLAGLGVDFFDQLAETVYVQKDVLDIFRHPDEFRSWEDVIAFNVVQDGGADIQLERFKRGPYGPWSDAIDQMEAEEVGHRQHGEHWVEKISKTEEGRERLRNAFAMWLPRALRAFGKPDAISKSLPLYQKYGFKDSNDDQRRELIANTKKLFKMCDFISPLIENPELAWSEESSSLIS